jgi:hypothetical protein
MLRPRDPANPSGDDDESSPHAAVPPGLGHRIVTRFALIAFALYHLPLVLNDYPSFGGGGFAPDGIAVAWGHVFGQVGLWVARHVFGMTGPMPDALSGDNGDTAEEYCRLLVAVVIAAIATAIWAAVDRKRPGAPWVDDALRTLLRYAIALGLASYAIAKIIPIQFGYLPPNTLEMRYGELPPMRLLWTFMQYSGVYSTFAGVAELAAVVLLCFRRTATLGALLCLAVMTNVALMNYCYGVPVKLFSTMITLSAIVLVAYDGRRLFDLFIRNRATTPAPIPAPRTRRHTAIRWAIKLVLVGGVIASSTIDMAHDYVEWQDAANTPVTGTWDVAAFTAGNPELPSGPTAASWRRVVISRIGTTIRFADDRVTRCESKLVAATLELACNEAIKRAVLRWTRSHDELRLDGTADDTPVSVILTHRDDGELPLLHARFQWIMD